MGAVLEDRLARRVRVGEHVGIDVDDHLISLPRRARINAVVERRLGDEGEGIGLLLAQRRRVVGDDQPCARQSVGPRFRGDVVSAPIQRLPACLHRLHEDGPRFRLQTPANDDHAVFVLIHVKCTALVAPSALLRLGDAVDPAPAPDDALDVLSGARPADLEQPLFGLGCRDPGQRSNL